MKSWGKVDEEFGEESWRRFFISPSRFYFLRRRFFHADEKSHSPPKHPPFSSVVQGTELPSLSTERHLVFPLKASFALHKGDLKKKVWKMPSQVSPVCKCLILKFSMWNFMPSRGFTKFHKERCVKLGEAWWMPQVSRIGVNNQRVMHWWNLWRLFQPFYLFFYFKVCLQTSLHEPPSSFLPSSGG